MLHRFTIADKNMTKAFMVFTVYVVFTKIPTCYVHHVEILVLHCYVKIVILGAWRLTHRKLKLSCF